MGEKRAQGREKLGIIGGLGPAATARLMRRLVDLTCAERDQDHLDVTVLSRPQIPDRTAYLLGRAGAASFVEPMQQAAAELEAAGCTVLATPCNTAHARLGQVASVLGRARFVHMLDEAAAFAARLGCTRAGVLATDGTRAVGVYDMALAGAGLAAAWPGEDGQRTVMAAIYDGVKAGRKVAPDVLEPVCAGLADAGCDGIILGCTELSLVGCPPRMAGVPVIDALDVLAWRCVQECGAPARDLAARYSEAETRPNTGGE